MPQLQMSTFTNGFSPAVAIRGIPVAVTHPGRVFWLYNGTTVQQGCQNGSDNNKGTFQSPFATLAGALLQVGNGTIGDIIFVKPGHAETVSAAAGIALNKSNIAIVGLGVGSTRPTFTLGTANTATITVAANNVSIYNCLFLANFLNIATVFDIVNAQVATDFVVDSCEFRDSTAILNFVKIVRIGTTANIADGFVFSNNRVIGLASSPGAGTTAISTASTINRVQIFNNFVSHQVLLAATAVLIATGALNLTNSLIQKNIVVRPNTDASNPLLFSTSGTGWFGTLVADNYCSQLSGATGLVGNVGTTAGFIQNFAMITGAADKSASVNPVAV